MATGLGPSDLLSAPPAVFEAILEVLEERSRENKREALKQRMRRG